MGAVTLLELRDLEGELLGRHRLANLPLSIGRSAECDVIVDDAQVSGNHARIEAGADGLPVLVDLGSRNGLVDPDRGARMDRVVLRPGLKVRLGDTTLVFRGPDEARPSTQLAVAPQRRGLQLDSWRAFLLAALGVYGAFALMTVVESSRPPDLGEVLGPQFVLLAVVMFYGGSWALVNRLLKRRFHYWGHTALGALALFALPVLGFATDLLGFGLAAEDAVELVAEALVCAVGAALLYGHFGWVTGWARARRAITSAAVVCAIGGVAWLTTHEKHSRFSTALPFVHTLEPPEFRMRRGVAPAEFFAHARGLQAELQRELDQSK